MLSNYERVLQASIDLTLMTYDITIQGYADVQTLQMKGRMDSVAAMQCVISWFGDFMVGTISQQQLVDAMHELSGQSMPKLIWSEV